MNQVGMVMSQSATFSSTGELTSIRLIMYGIYYSILYYVVCSCLLYYSILFYSIQYGNTPLDIAYQNNRSEVIALLKGPQIYSYNFIFRITTFFMYLFNMFIISDFVPRLTKISMIKVVFDANAFQDISTKTTKRYMRHFIKSKYLQNNILKYI